MHATWRSHLDRWANRYAGDKHKMNCESNTDQDWSGVQRWEKDREIKEEFYCSIKNSFPTIFTVHAFMFPAGYPQVCALTFEPSSPGSNLHPAINCRPGVSHTGRSINVCAVHRVDVKLASRLPAPHRSLVDVKRSYGLSRWVGDLSPALWANYKLLPLSVEHCLRPASSWKDLGQTSRPANPTINWK